MNVRLRNWERIWGHRASGHNSHRDCTVLSIQPVSEPDAKPDAGIDGVIVPIAVSDLPALDEREYGYERITLPLDAFVFDDKDRSGIHSDTIVAYRSRSENRHPADEQHPVLKSYADCAMAGYLERFGEAGLVRMIESTQGWHRSFLDDRDQPLYSRSVPLPCAHLALFDRLLAAFET